MGWGPCVSILLFPPSSGARTSQPRRPLLTPARSARQGRIPPAAHRPLLTPQSAALECGSESTPVSKRASTRTQLRRRGASGRHPGGGARTCRRAATRVLPAAAQCPVLPVWGQRQLLCSIRPGSGWLLWFNCFDDFVSLIHVSDFLCS